MIITKDRATFTVEMKPEATILEGNVSAIDAETDAKNEEQVRLQIEQGNDWAWCSVVVTASWGLFAGFDSLGCCCFASEEAFKEAYLDEMQELALENLNAQVVDALYAVVDEVTGRHI